MKLTAAEYQQMLKPKAKPVARWETTSPPEGKLSESQQQAECVRWFRQQFPEFEKLLYAVPNGGFRNKRTAAILRKEGVISGIPDQCLAVARKGFHGLYIEQKIKGNKPTDNQKELLSLLTAQGYKCEVAYSITQFKEIITTYLT
jgi:hypothetical protein